MRRLGTCLASTNREALGFRPARNWVCHCELAGRGQASGAKTPCSRTSTGVCQVPGRTDQGFKTPRRDAERRCRVPLFLGDPGNKPRPLPRCAFRRPVSPQGGEKKLKAQFARRRDDESAWLFEIRIGKFSQGVDATTAVIARSTCDVAIQSVLRSALRASGLLRTAGRRVAPPCWLAMTFGQNFGCRFSAKALMPSLISAPRMLSRAR
jgi:hypothetical protein